MSISLFSGLPGLSIDGGLYKGVQGLWSGLSGFLSGLQTSLSLDFLSGTTLDRRITFSRTTNATLVDATGKLTYAPNNLVTNSEAFEDAAWTKTSSTIAANVAVAPNGTSTADKHIPNAGVIMGTGAAETRVFQSPTATLGVNYVFSIYAKAGEYDQIALAVITASPPIALFSLTLGTVVSGTGATITPVGNGWYRCAIVATASATGALALRWSAKSSTVSVGDGTSGIFVWGAQFEAVTYQTAPSAYNSTSPANLLGFTEEFDNAAWTKFNTTVTANATLSPDGTANADAFIENTVASAFHFMGQSVTKSAANIPVAGSFYLKNKGRQVSFNIQNAAGSSGVVGRVNPATGTVTQSAIAFGSGFTAGTITITDVGNDWYRVAMTATSDTSTTVSFQFVLHNGTSTVYTGDGVSGAFLWGAQLSNSASVDPYVYNPAAAPTSIAYYGPRFDYNPVTLAPNGLLIEEQRTNLVFAASAVTGWAATPGGAVTATANATTSPDGTGNATKIATGDTLSNNHTWYTTFSGAISTVYTGSVYLKAGEYTRAQINFENTAFASAVYGVLVDLSNGTIVATSASTTATITNAGNGWYRCTVTATSDADGGAYVFAVSPKPASATTINAVYTPASVGLGVFLYGAQVETGAFATSHIPTVASTITRAPDIVSMLGSNFSSWYNQSQGTIIPQFVATTTGVNSAGGNDFPFVYDIDSAAVTNSGHTLLLSAGYGPGWTVATTILGVGQTAFGAAMSLGNASVRKIGYAYQTNNFAASANGGAVLTDTSGNLPTTPDRLNIGNQNGANSNIFTGYIRAFTYYPSRLSDAQLQEITSPSLVTTLSLGFLSGVLDPRITFSRTTNATLVDATGRVTYAPNNLLTNSEAFENAVWSKLGSSITPNTTAAPNGTFTADSLVEDGATSGHRVAQNPSGISTLTYTATFFAKLSGRSWARVLVDDTGNGVDAYFDLFNGVVGTTNSFGTGLFISASITPVGNGWYRCSVTCKPSGTATGTVRSLISGSTGDGVSTYLGTNGLTSLFLWGAQLELVTYQTTPGTYNSTSPANLLGFTEEFDNAAWTKQASVSVLPNTTIAPNGTLTGDTVTADSGFGVFQNVTVTIGTIVTQSVYLKAGTATDVMFRDDTGAGRRITVNTSTGAIISTGGVILSSSSTSAGNGWWRIAFSYVADTTVVRAIIRPDSAGAGQTLIVWGAQTSNSASLDPYVYNPAAAPTSAAYYGPRFDYNPTTLAANGLLIEEQRVNLVLYSEQFDNAGWTKAGATITANSTTSPDGTADADKLVENTALSQHRVQQAVTTVIGTSYTHTIYLKAGERTTVTLRVAGTATFAGCTVNLATGTISAVTGVGTITNAGGGWYRVSVTGTADSTTTTCFVNLSDGSITYTGDGVSGAFLYGAQLEAGSFATSYIPTVASTVTRAADSASMLGTNFSNWYNQSEGAFVVQGKLVGGSSAVFPYQVSAVGSNANADALGINWGSPSGSMRGAIRAGGVGTLDLNAGSAKTAGSSFKSAIAYATNDGNFATEGAVATTDTSVTLPLAQSLLIGGAAVFQPVASTWFSGITYYPVRLSDRQLQVATI